MTLVGIIRGSPFKNQHWWLGIVGQFDVEEALRRHLATRLAGSPPQHQIDPLRGWAAPALQLKGLLQNWSGLAVFIARIGLAVLREREIIE
jgi:hypothetical protein